MKYVLHLFLIFLPVGCFWNTDETEIHFGYRYEIDQTDEYPVISNDTLIVKVSYQTCEGNHEFAVKHQKETSSIMEVWLVKQTPDQDCEMIVSEKRSFKLQSEIIESDQIYLIGPNEFGTTYIRLK